MLQTRNLCKSFGRQKAVDDVSLTVREGDIYGFLGLNGAGKTTTLRMVLGLLAPDSGEVSLFGQTARGARRAALADIGAMVEGPAFYGRLSGAANLRQLARLTAPVSEARITEVLETVGLTAAGAKAARDYSLGMKQRLGIALALVSRPKLVVLDEPTNGLDPNGILEMRRLIRRLNRDEGVTFLISSHLLHEIEMVCNRVGILEKGRLVVEEDVATLLRSLTQRLVLRTAADGRAVELLGTFKGVTDLAKRDDHVLFRLDHDRLPELHRALTAGGIDVFTLAEQRVTLEEFFMQGSDGKREGALT